MSFSEFNRVKLNEALDFYNGKKRPNSNGDIPVYGGNGILDFCNDYNTEGDNIIIGRVGAYCGNVNYVRGKCWISDNAILTKSKNDFDSSFLYYVLVNENLHQHHIGSSQPLLTQGILKTIEINKPDYVEQKKIAKLLSSLDEKIEVNNQINKTLENMAQAIFKQWFVDFEFPNEDGEPYLSSGGEMVDSELGMIPKGWEVKGLDDIAEYLNGLAMQKFRPEENERSYPVLKIKELRQGATSSDSDICSMNIEKRYVVKDGDVIFSWSGSLLVDIWCGGFCGLNQHLFKVTSDKYEKWFYYYWTNYHLERFISIAKSKATTMGHINRKDLTDSKVVVPSEDIYIKATSFLKPILDRLTESKIESRQLNELRDTLLPKLMSGEIRVPLDSEGEAS